MDKPALNCWCKRNCADCDEYIGGLCKGCLHPPCEECPANKHKEEA